MTHRAIVVTEIGKPLVLVERPTPLPVEGELLLKVAIVGINPHDSSAASKGLFIANSLPTPLGIDIVGTVVAVGPSAAPPRFRIGDTILGLGSPSKPDSSGTQEYALLESNYCSFMPAGINPDEAATLPLNALTSTVALFSRTGLNLPSPFKERLGEIETTDLSGQSIVIIGGGSATGKFAIQLAKIAGFGKIVTVAGLPGEAIAKALGATHVVDRIGSEDDIVERVRKVVGDNCLHVVDCVGGRSGEQTLGVRVLSNKRKGTVVALIHRGTVDEKRIENKNNGYELKKILANAETGEALAEDFFQALPSLIENKQISPTAWRVVDGLTAENVNAVIDGFVDGRWPVKAHIHV